MSWCKSVDTCCERSLMSFWYSSSFCCCFSWNAVFSRFRVVALERLKDDAGPQALIRADDRELLKKCLSLNTKEIKLRPIVLHYLILCPTSKGKRPNDDGVVGWLTARWANATRAENKIAPLHIFQKVVTCLFCIEISIKILTWLLQLGRPVPWWYYPTPSEGWGCGGTLRRPNSRATPQGLDHRSKIEREEPKIDLRRGSEAGQSRRWLRFCRGCPRALQAEFSFRLILWRYEDKRRLWPWQRRRESSQRIGRERSSSSKETLGTWWFR